MKSLISGMSTCSLLASCASPSHASNQVRDGSLGNIVPFIDMHVVYKAAAEECDLWIRKSFGSVHISLVSLKQTFGY